MIFMVEGLITVLKSKIHRATVTATNIEYEGSCLISAALMEAAGILEYEQIHVYNVNNGERFITYAMASHYIPSDVQQVLEVNGAATHKVSVGDIVIVCAFHLVTPYAPRVPVRIFVDHQNRIMNIH